jgi:hypothetical protein
MWAIILAALALVFTFTMGNTKLDPKADNNAAAGGH